MAGADELEEFRLIRPLGRGGMGEVYLGHDTVLDRPVAIKLIGSRNPDAASRERFLTEARAIARLSHPNVVTIFRVGTTGDGRPFLAQELIRGTGLDQLARPVPWRRVCELAVGIARGLDAAHRRGILHRDIKPANVMLDDQGTARLLDFGLAKLTGGPERGLRDTASSIRAPADPADLVVTRDGPGAAAPSSAPPIVALGSEPTEVPAAPEANGHTRTGSVLGTPRYTAPEIWRGERATERSDLYSLGVMLYELASAVPPYPEADLVELERAVLAGGARPVDELGLTISPVFARLIMRCLALDPAGRPTSAAELVHELEAILVDAPAVPAGNPYRGLRAFDAEHRGVFFGRGTDVSVLVDRLRTESLLVVVGDSGIGKSSVCHAGVVPAVIAGALADRRRWRAVTIVPGRRPWDTMREALGIAGEHADDRAFDLLRAARPAGDEGLLIVVDQLEELITLADPGQARRIAEMLAAIADGGLAIKALLAVRGDFLTRIAALPEIGGAITRGLHLLRVLSPSDLREAVVGPARTSGVRFESDQMVDQLVAAVAGNPGALPLLQFTLAELWQARDLERAVIPQRALEVLGGVEGGLAGHADAVLLELGAAQRAAARRIVMRLVTAAHTRAVRERDELIDEGEVSAAALESLVRGRLVVARDTVDGTPGYELAHEALIRSWGTLRDWLDAAAGEHAARNRLIASAAEWHRLGRRSELLWSRRQLDETREVADLTQNEEDFLRASRRHLRRRRLGRIAAVAALPVLALAIWAGLRLDAAARRDRAVAERVATAADHRTRADAFAADATRARAAAFARFDANDSAGGERQWAEARRLGTLAHAAYGDATAELEAAHLLDPGAVREQMALVLASHARLAEAERDRQRAAELERRLATYDPQHAHGAASGHLVVSIAGAVRLAVHARRAGAGPVIAGHFDASPVIEREGATLEADLAPGSYVVVATMRDGAVVRDPVLIERGERVTRELAIPAASTIPAGFVYVAAGRFLFGTGHDEAVRRDFLGAQPLHPIETAAYLIARTEVTFAQWIEYLRDLSPPEREARRPASRGGAIGSVKLEEAGDRFTLILQPTKQAYRAVEGEPLAYPERTIRTPVRWERLPVSGVSWEDALAYTAWLDRTGRVPGARPCTNHEWERAARGADGRAYPHGETLAPDEASIDVTYGRKPLAYGPDEVGSFPASDSPFGVSDLAGNVWEVVAGPTGQPWAKGGGWYQGMISALSSNHNAVEVTQKDIRIGLRVCASVR
ncbi:MAG: protein kinase [Myxococcales bacterium]|nr:protein kinase [Myxococcales bacterium]